MMREQEIPLTGGTNAKEIVRIGNIVHRTKHEQHLFIKEVLLHLEAKGFSYAPRYLGQDEQDRTMLNFLVGEVPRGLALSEEQLIQAARLLRQFHDATRDFPQKAAEEVICHRDFAPWNIIIHQGSVSGIIDFDEVAPGKRIEDFAYFSWTFLELGSSLYPLKRQLRMLKLLAAAYGSLQTSQFVDALLAQQARILQLRRELVPLQEEPESRQAAEERVARIQAEIAWVEQHREVLAACVAAIH
ncbi:MAG: aminoglycoside phosphotransferase family protein [Bacteroidota bacterium]